MNSKYRFSNIVGRSEAIKRVFALMEQAIELDTDILITGETGTGKDLVAKEIHDHSRRRAKRLFAINCGALPKEVLFSELFGYRKSAFSGAIEDKAGVFEAVKGGTVILDDMVSMPLDIQLDLFNVLNERKVQRIGEYTLREVNMRVIAISNRDLTEEVKAGRFREDLYQHLSSFHIHLLPLRERIEDIPLLAEHFRRQVCRQISKEIDGFAPDVLEMLQRYPWPGNVRELRNQIRQACLLVGHDERIQMHHFFPQTNLGKFFRMSISK